MSPSLRSSLDKITNMLFGGGVNNPITYIQQISYLIYLKLLDERENELEIRARLLGESAGTKTLFPLQASRFRWNQWRFKPAPELQTFLSDEVFPYLGTLVREAPRVAAYFQEARLDIQDPNVVKQVVDEIDKIEFAKLGTDAKGDIFEYLLQYLSTMEGALLGQFRTPRQIRRMMVDLVDPDFGDTIYDPACGTGGFLIDAVEHILAKYSEHPAEVPIYGEDWLEKRGQTLEQAKAEFPKLQTYRKGPGEKVPNWNLLEKSIFGHDVSRELMRIAMMNLVLHGVPDAALRRANTLSDVGGLTDEDLSRRYKVILSNPPFAGVLPKDSIRSDLPTNSKKSELLFLSVMMEALAPGGRCAVVVPEGVLFGSTTAHKELREKLIEDFEVLAVISLPAGVFKPYAGVKTSVLVFRRPQYDEDRNGKTKPPSPRKVLFYDIRNDGFDPDKVSGGGRVATPGESDIPGLLQAWASYRKSSFKNVPGIEAETVLPADAPECNCWWATIEKICNDNYNLSPSRYKPLKKKAIIEEDPKELIHRALNLESVIVDDLKDLLKRVETNL